MKIVDIYPPFLYSIQYENAEEDEFERLFQQWNDVEYVVNFFEENKEMLSHSIWVNVASPEEAARQVLKEAEELENLLIDLCENLSEGSTPDLDSHFKYLEGKYKYELEYVPMKSYGPIRPSLLRMYAIRFASNMYLITGGGIKLADTIQNSPDLKDHVLQNIDKVRSWLKAKGIYDSDDIN